MKKMFLTVLLVAGFTVCAFAEHPKAEHPSAVEKDMTPAERDAFRQQYPA